MPAPIKAYLRGPVRGADVSRQAGPLPGLRRRPPDYAQVAAAGFLAAI